MIQEQQLIEAIIGAIERDFTDRRGLKQAWEDIDPHVRTVIRETWAQRVKEALDDYTPRLTPDKRLERLEKKVKKLGRRLKGAKGGRPPMR